MQNLMAGIRVLYIFFLAISILYFLLALGFFDYKFAVLTDYVELIFVTLIPLSLALAILKIEKSLVYSIFPVLIVALYVFTSLSFGK